MPASPYVNAAQAAAAKYGIPESLLLRQVNEESGWNPQAKSPAGAMGLLQLMPGTARGLGVSNPFDPVQNLDAGARYLREQYDRFHDWHLALAAYNAGPGNVENGNWRNIPETVRYVHSILDGLGPVGSPAGAGPGVSETPAVGRAPAPDFSPADLGMLMTIIGGGTPSPTQLLSSLEQPAQPQQGVEPQPRGMPQGHSGFDYPLGTHGKVIGVPYQGSHTLYGNWESDNAVDLAVPVGTPVYAVTSGTIGSQIGSLGSSDPHLQGLRVHLQSPDNEFYYQHLSRLVVRAGQHVQAGQLIGYSGAANGVAHLHFASKRHNPLQLLGVQ